ncbi:MAG: Trp family transcriptional regulator [bacterium]
MAKHVGAVNEQDVRDVAALFAGVSNQQEMRRMLDEILTPSELHNLALRWKLMQHLQAGVPQRRIATELGISLCKITRGSRILKRPQGMIRGILERKGRAAGA